MSVADLNFYGVIVFALLCTLAREFNVYSVCDRIKLIDPSCENVKTSISLPEDEFLVEATDETPDNSFAAEF